MQICVLILLLYYIYLYVNTIKSINEFNIKLENKKSKFIESFFVEDLKKSYEKTYKKANKICFKNQKIETFIYTYVNIKKIVEDLNEEFLKIEEIKKIYSYNNDMSNNFLNQIEKLKEEYFTSSTKDNLLADYKEIYRYFTKEEFIKAGYEIPYEFINTYKNLDKLISNWNQSFIKKELKKYKDFFDNVDGKSLDLQQRVAVITDDTNNLILAGAGSGKTLTIAAKVKYLVECKNICPEEILLISFTKKSAEEMTNRITKELSRPIEAKTFHKLGYDILNCEPSAISDDLNMKISSYFKEKVISDVTKIQEILEFFLYYLNIPKDLEDFETFGEYIDENQALEFTTLKSKYELTLMQNKINDMSHELYTIKKEKLKSLEEVMIANYLFMNGIEYEYEKEYPYKDEQNPKRTYHPDFYLKDYDLYLEHFGINKSGRLPWLTKIEENKYLFDMEWKREWHRKNGTKLIETYSYYNKEHELLLKLKELLIENGVKLTPVNYTEIYQKVYANDEDYNFKEFEKLIYTFIQLFKANGYEYLDFEKLNKKSVTNTFQHERNRKFIEIIKPIFEYYQNSLKNANKIDYNDMINKATESIKNNGINQKYKYIIIDEYQDISLGRYKLIKEIIQATHAKLFCVGDDWQSIYRFSGSDINLFTEFSKYFGEAQILKIEKTYRNSQQLLDITKKFVSMNPEQLVKSLKSNKTQTNPIMVMMYSSELTVALHSALTDIKEKYGEEASVLLLGRTKFDIKDCFSSYFNYNVKNDEITYEHYPKMKIKFLTVHSSKGLEADNVIILNMKNTLLGFPNKISDDEVLSLVLQNKDNYPYAEERRLFYVALTRTKNQVYLLVPDKRQSIFYHDLTKISELPTQTTSKDIIIDQPTCPRCQRGILLLKENNGTKFIGCSNYPYCNYTSSSTEILKNTKRCPKCRRFFGKKER